MFIKQEVDLKQAKAAIEEGKIVYTDDTQEDRGVGKTTNIVAYSIWADKPIMVDNTSRVKLLKEQSEIVDIYHINYITSSSLFPNGVLIDDGMSKESLQKLISLLGEDKVSGFMTHK